MRGLQSNTNCAKPNPKRRSLCYGNWCVCFKARSWGRVGKTHRSAVGAIGTEAQCECWGGSSRGGEVRAGESSHYRPRARGTYFAGSPYRRCGASCDAQTFSRKFSQPEEDHSEQPFAMPSQGERPARPKSSATSKANAWAWSRPVILWRLTVGKSEPANGVPRPAGVRPAPMLPQIIQQGVFSNAVVVDVIEKKVLRCFRWGV